MKNIYITLSTMLLFTVIYGQDKSTEKADKLFQSYQYAAAIDQYLHLANSKKADDYIYKQLADSYYHISDMENASKWYAKAVGGNVSAETHYRYAQTLKALGQYQEANKQMDIFADKEPNDSRAKEYKANPNYISGLMDKPKMFDAALTNLKNEGQSDFGAVLTNENLLYFVSTRGKSKKTDTWTNQPSLDIFQSTRNSDGTLTEPTPVNELNTPYNDGPATISNDGKTMFFTRNLHSEGKFEKIKKNNKTLAKAGQQGLFKAIKKDGKWTQIEALPFNSTSYSVSAPSLSKDGKTLFFASNMPGGYGESDIWRVSIDANGYGKPENLGERINTPDKENFPFIDDDNILYFASSGKPGLGGLDVFRIDLNANEQAQNLGKPVNSSKDDFSFALNKTFNIAYFSSNRSGSDVIYTATPICEAEAIAVVTNKKTGALLSNAEVSLLDAKGSVVATKQSGSDGKVNFDVECGKDYNFLVKAQNFESATISSSIKTGENMVQASLEPSEVIITETEVILNPIYFDYNKSDITAQGAVELDKLVKVMNDNPTLVIFVKSHTDTKGSAAYNLKLSERRAQATVQYLISKGIASSRLSGKGYGSSEPKIKCGKKCSDEENAQNRRSEFLIVKK